MTNTAAAPQRKEGLQNLDQVNQDWNLLNELGQSKSRFVINQKASSAPVAKTAKDIAEVAAIEDATIAEQAQADDRAFEQAFEVSSTRALKAETPPVANDDAAARAASLKERLQGKDSQVGGLSQNKSANFKQEIIGTNPLLKLIAIGLTKLYVKKTSTVLNPVKFVAENYKDVLIAMLHMGVPAILTWIMLTKVEFISSQLIDVSTGLYWLYATVFYFGALFTWVTAQVLFAGIMVMVKNTLISVAKDAAREDI